MARQPVQTASRAGIVALGIGCSGGTSTAPTERLPDGWISSILQEPAVVLDRIGTDEVGWAALHRGDLSRALQSDDPALVQRAEQEVRETREALLELQHHAGLELVRQRARQGSLPSGTAMHTWAALLAMDGGEDPAPFLQLAPTPADPGWAGVHTTLGDRWPEAAGLALLAERAEGPLRACLQAHQAVRSGQSPLEVVAQACPSPLLAEADGVRILPSPLRLRTRAAGVAPAAPIESWLPATLFSATWGPEDQATAPLAGPTAQRLGLAGPPPTSPADALDRVQAVTRTLDAWGADDSAEGARLAAELDAFEVYRTRLLASWVSNTELPPLIASEILRGARDAEAGRTLGPTRPPSLLALEAGVAVQTGHHRSALPPLQALAPLASVFPELPALTELVNDLQVAATIGRTGDSKEL